MSERFRVEVLAPIVAQEKYPDLFNEDYEDDPYFSECTDGMNPVWTDSSPDKICIVWDGDKRLYVLSAPSNLELT